MPKRPDRQHRRRFLKTLTAAGAGAVFAENASPVAAADTPALGPVPKRKFGCHSEMIALLALGGATLAHAASIEEATRIVADAIDWGVTFFDNAWEYSDGRAEEWMGTALRGKRDKVFLMSNVCTHLKGQETKDKALEKNARVAASFKPFSREEMAALEQRCSSKKQYEYYRRWAYCDGHPRRFACA
jgi:predicted aldo/keto reductase-like oxidoreductase